MDFPALSHIGKKHGLTVIADNTWGPTLFKPLQCLLAPTTENGCENLAGNSNIQAKSPGEDIDFGAEFDSGADVSINAATKYIGGHSDIMMGIIACRSPAVYSRILRAVYATATAPADVDCELALKGACMCVYVGMCVCMNVCILTYI
jgi:hypothetical protein